jgi:hypothetical protein
MAINRIPSIYGERKEGAYGTRPTFLNLTHSGMSIPHSLCSGDDDLSATV